MYCKKILKLKDTFMGKTRQTSAITSKIGALGSSLKNP